MIVNSEVVLSSSTNIRLFELEFNDKRLVNDLLFFILFEELSKTEIKSDMDVFPKIYCK
jgi:hypothetical protein